VYIVQRNRLVACAIETYPAINDRIHNTKDYQCQLDPAVNPKFIMAFAFVGHHIPCIVIVVSYVMVFFEIRKLFKVRPGAKPAAASKATARVITVAPAPIADAQPPPGTSKDRDAGRNEAADDGKQKNRPTESDAAANDNSKKKELKNEQTQQPKQQQQQLKRPVPGTGFENINKYQNIENIMIFSNNTYRTFSIFSIFSEFYP